MRLHDTLTRTERELRPLDGSVFRFYCCGPTVYGPAHIGNFRTFVLQDVLLRTLEVAMEVGSLLIAVGGLEGLWAFVCGGGVGGIRSCSACSHHDRNTRLRTGPAPVGVGCGGCCARGACA